MHQGTGSESVCIHKFSSAKNPLSDCGSKKFCESRKQTCPQSAHLW